MITRIWFGKGRRSLFGLRKEKNHEKLTDLSRVGRVAPSNSAREDGELEEV